MKKILTASQMKFCDEREINNGTPSATLMERAASEVYRGVKNKFWCSEKPIFVCGNGNNGGDGLLAAILAKKDGMDAAVLFVGDEEKCSPECARRLQQARAEGIVFVSEADFKDYDLIVDAIFGIGLTRNAEGRFAEIINKINESHVEILSVDIPSGAFADSAEGHPVVNADYTVAIQAYKYANIRLGRCECVDIGISSEDMDAPSAMEKGDVKELLGRRPVDCHKGTYGRVLVIGGDVGMCGAPYFSALGAYRSGAGLVEIFTSVENRSAVQTLIPEAVVTCVDFARPDLGSLDKALSRASAVCIGMGMGQSNGARKILEYTLENVKCPVVIDADALNMIAHWGFEIPENAVITPHPMELSRLTDKSVGGLKEDLINNAKALAKEKKCIVLAKDARSVITDGETVTVNSSGSPALAKGGSGDVLSGVIGAFLARGLSPLDSASLGAYVHGKAGEFCAEDISLGEEGALARDIANKVAYAIEWGKDNGRI